MSSPVDPNKVMMTGENSFIRYSADGGKTQTDRASHWRVLWCPAGAGHALFLKSTLTAGEVRIWSDNPPVARWLQKEIESLLFPAFADAKTPVAPAAFARSGGIDSRAAAGMPYAEKRGECDSSSACLAWSETWVRPNG